MSTSTYLDSIKSKRILVNWLIITIPKEIISLHKDTSANLLHFKGSRAKVGWSPILRALRKCTEHLNSTLQNQHRMLIPTSIRWLTHSISRYQTVARLIRIHLWMTVLRHNKQEREMKSTLKGNVTAADSNKYSSTPIYEWMEARRFYAFIITTTRILTLRWTLSFWTSSMLSTLTMIFLIWGLVSKNSTTSQDGLRPTLRGCIAWILVKMTKIIKIKANNRKYSWLDNARSSQTCLDTWRGKESLAKKTIKSTWKWTSWQRCTSLNAHRESVHQIAQISL